MEIPMSIYVNVTLTIIVLTLFRMVHTWKYTRVSNDKQISLFFILFCVEFEVVCHVMGQSKIFQQLGAPVYLHNILETKL